jgi:hypothetical protein
MIILNHELKELRRGDIKAGIQFLAQSATSWAMIRYKFWFSKIACTSCIRAVYNHKASGTMKAVFASVLSLLIIGVLFVALSPNDVSQSTSVAGVAGTELQDLVNLFCSRACLNPLLFGMSG